MRLADRGEVGVVDGDGLRAGDASAEPDEAHFERIGERRRVAQCLRVVEAVRVQREVGLHHEQIEVRVHEWRRVLQQRGEMEVEEDREALPGSEREVAHSVAVFPKILPRRGVGEIDDPEAERGGNLRRRLDELSLRGQSGARRLRQRGLAERARGGRWPKRK
ncbi:MAG: hypothetical protein ABIZ56_04635 [Chthoniobacteraceae bacterium]